MATENNPLPPQKDKRGYATIAGMLFVALTVGVLMFNLTSNQGNTKIDSLTATELTQALEQGRVKEVTSSSEVGASVLSGVYYPSSTAGSTGAEAFNGAFDALNAKMATIKEPETNKQLSGVSTTTLEKKTLGSEHKFTANAPAGMAEYIATQYPQVSLTVSTPSVLDGIIASLVPLIPLAVILGGLSYIVIKKTSSAQMGFGKSRAKKTTEERPNVRFADVAGVDDAVEELQEIKDFLENPAKYQAMGAKIPRGCLLVGPPGTGKTLLARAVAGEAGVPFFSISGSDFVEMFVGVGASRVRDLFKQAKEAAPAIIFIDEIDAVGRKRGVGMGGGNDEREQTLNQLLVEMDGFEATDSVVLIAATNRADVLDPALLRPGRFDRQIVVDEPDIRGRERILKVHAKGKPMGSDVDLTYVAKITSGFSGADLANLLNEAALLAARRNQKIITQHEMNEAMERVYAGTQRRGRAMSEHTKKIIAYHESGHALVSHLLDKANPVHKITIVSRGRALGYTMQVPDEDRILVSRSAMRDELAVFLGGRVAEEIYCDDITTGASNDLERATKMARAMVTQYGMSVTMGTQVFGEPNRGMFIDIDGANKQDYSDETARRIDAEVASIMKEAHDRAHEILSTHREHMDLMAEVLLDRETVEGEACQALLDNKWNEYLEHEDEIMAQHAAEEKAARERDEALLKARELNQGNVTADQLSISTQVPPASQDSASIQTAQISQVPQAAEWDPPAPEDKMSCEKSVSSANSALEEGEDAPIASKQDQERQ